MQAKLEAMSAKPKKPKNRFLAGTHVSEDVLVRVLFCWLHGMTHSAIPDAVLEDGGYVDLGMGKLQETLGERFTLTQGKSRKVSRQATHKIIRAVSVKILSKEFYDRRNNLTHWLETEIPDRLLGKLWMEPVIGKNPSQEQKIELVTSMRDQSVQDHFEKQKQDVLEISSDAIPYEDIRQVPGALPSDVYENHVMVTKMRERYKRFRGYKPSGMITHVAHQVSIRQGADMLFIHEGDTHGKALPQYDQMETAEYWLLCVTHALTVLLIQLETGQSYDHIKGKVIN
tara:strand:+ start:761 stop:1615 length:855 start_codon:yes stop_codon:yes gene_type:complete